MLPKVPISTGVEQHISENFNLTFYSEGISCRDVKIYDAS
jgi:hypothetical protein